MRYPNMHISALASCGALTSRAMSTHVHVKTWHRDIRPRAKAEPICQRHKEVRLSSDVESVVRPEHQKAMGLPMAFLLTTVNYLTNFLKISVALVPPKPKLLDITVVNERCCNLSTTGRP